ncbi:MAG TPA: site-specific integrase [Candidatus Hydrogenedentes bacterium]|nr:site-specific integrase [Candidatus Hydrogenedentota bacterium]
MQDKITSRTFATFKPKPRAYEVFDTELPGFSLRVETGGTMTYYARYRMPDGTRGRVKIGSAAALTPEQARSEAKKKIADATRGHDPAAARRQDAPVKLGAFIETQYYPNHGQNLRTGKMAQDRMKTAWKDFWNIAMRDITPGKVEQWRASRIAKGMKASTANRYLDDLRSVLSKATEWEVIAEHPLRSLKRIKTDRSAKVRYLSADEEKNLMEALDKREERIRAGRESANEWRKDRNYVEMSDLRRRAFADYLKPMILLSLHTGMRRGEVFSLTWSDIDFDLAVLTVRGAVAKSGTTRHIPLNAVALETMKAWREQVSAHGLVFPAANGERFDNVKTSWEGLLEEAKITAFRWHDMRHHFASKLVMKGVDLNTVRELLGHSDIAMTLRYAHLAPSVKADAVARLVAPKGKIVQLSERKRGKQ